MRRFVRWHASQGPLIAFSRVLCSSRALRRDISTRGKVLGVLRPIASSRVMVVGTLTDVTSGVAAAGVCLLALVAPFESTRPLLRLPWQSVSSLEAALVLALAAWGVAVIRSGRAPDWHIPLAPVWLAFLLAMSIAALTAPAERTNASHMAGRFVAAAAVYALTVHGITSSARLRLALAISVGSGVIVAVLAWLEYFQVAPVLEWLRVFRPGVTAVGSQVRAGGPLQYPTIASMYLE